MVKERSYWETALGTVGKGRDSADGDWWWH